MAETKCSTPNCVNCDPAARAKIEAYFARERAAGQPWVARHRDLPLTAQDAAETAALIARMPRSTQRVALRFPPFCLVRSRAGVELVAPPPGLVAYVLGYHECDDAVILRVGPDAPLISHASADDLELVECVPGYDAAFVRRAAGQAPN